MRKNKILPLCLASVATALAVGGFACDDDDFDDIDQGTVDYYYEYSYPYTYYYPSDLMYSSYYWSDAWLYDSYIYQGGVNTLTNRASIGSVVRSLARGEEVCPGQVTVTPKTAPAACAVDDVTEVRSGVTIVFAGCKTADGATIDGTLDVQAQRTADEATCSENTRITLSHTATLSNLSITGVAGNRVVIPNQVDTGTNSYIYGQLPEKVDINSTGQLQLFEANGTLRSDQRFSGLRSFTYNSENRSYAVSGTAATQDILNGASTNIVGSDVTRTMDCCHPSGGSLVVTRAGGNRPGQHTWTFGPTCGQMTVDGSPIMAPACP
jgi:hypothetical protein